MDFLKRLAGRAASGPGMDSSAREALAGVLANPTFELIPLKNVHDQAAFLPTGATVSVTASPAKGIEATLDLAEALQARGLHAIPHLSARMIRDRSHLGEVLARLKGAGIDRAFVVGGDAEEPGDFADGLSLLRAMAELGGAPSEIGVPCYPQGHAVIPQPALLQALRDKAAFASYMTTQLCFDPVAIRVFIAGRRADGITLPVKIGIPGVAEIPKLLSISARIGVKDTSRFLSKNVRFVSELVTSGGIYRPTGLLEKLAPLLADPKADVIDLHVYTFNQVEFDGALAPGLPGGDARHVTPSQENVCRRLAATPARLEEAAAALGLADPSTPPAPGEWSAQDITLHLAAVEVGVWHVRLDALGTETFPEWPWVEPDRWPLPEGESFEAAVAIFAAHRTATLGRLQALDQEGWARRGRHTTFGVLDVGALMEIALDHDEEHVAQISGA